MIIYNSVITEAVMKIRLHGQAVKTLASHAGIRGSIPLGVTIKKCLQLFCRHFFVEMMDVCLLKKSQNLPKKWYIFWILL